MGFDVTALCSLIYGYKRYGGTWVYWFLKMEAALSPETLVTTSQTTPCLKQEGFNLHFHLLWYLKIHVLLVCMHRLNLSRENLRSRIYIGLLVLFLLCN
jgi:hypothetical protein